MIINIFLLLQKLKFFVPMIGELFSIDNIERANAISKFEIFRPHDWGAFFNTVELVKVAYEYNIHFSSP